MQNVGGIVRLALVTLCFVELAVTLLRFRHAAARKEAAWFSLLLAVFACRLLVPRGGLGDIAILCGVVLCTGNLLIAINRKKGEGAWTLSVLALAAVLLGVDLLLVHDPDAERFLRAIPFGAFAIPPVALLFVLWRKTGEVADFFILGFAAAWGISVCLEATRVLPATVSDWFLAPVLLLLGFMIFEQGYLSPLTS
ncbi:MAG TPA: hypothetical protein VHE79_00235, partial [Spirochaetia bacterium]